MIVLRSITVACPRLLTVSDSVVLFVFFCLILYGAPAMSLTWHDSVTLISTLLIIIIIIIIIIFFYIRFWYLRCCGCPWNRGRQHLATPLKTCHNIEAGFIINYRTLVINSTFIISHCHHQNALDVIACYWTDHLNSTFIISHCHHQNALDVIACYWTDHLNRWSVQ